MLRLKRKPRPTKASSGVKGASPSPHGPSENRRDAQITHRLVQGERARQSPPRQPVQPSPSESWTPLQTDYRLHPQVEKMAKQYIFNELPINLLHVPTKTIWNQHKIWSHVESAIKTLQPQDIPQNLRYPGQEPDLANVIPFVEGLLKWAIFSHRWGTSEPTYQEVMENRLTSKPGHVKLRKLCETAHNQHDAEFVWSDTCCINKKDKAEYARTIRSMYRWYANAPLCIAYLGDTTSMDDFERDAWFTRGWTLQELLAPKKLKFYNKEWCPLTTLPNDRESQSIAEHVEHAASVTSQDFRHFVPADRMEQKYEISKRMRWAARRETTVPEDIAYCLMGIFGVSMFIDPGEGRERAVWRLMAEILQFSNSPEVLNWAGPPGREMSLNSHAFPSLPECFNDSNDLGTIIRNDEELCMTPLGMRVDVLLFTAELVSREDTAPVFQTVGGEVSVAVLDHRDLQLGGDANEYAFGVWNFNSYAENCVPTGSTFEALLLKRQIDATTRRKSKWVKICTKRFVRLEGMETPPQGRSWGAFREKIWV